MLGELIGQGSGRIESIRVLPDRSLSSSGPPDLEVSFQGTGELLGLAVSVVGTYSQIILLSGSLYGESRTLFITEDGETLSWRGLGWEGPPDGDLLRASGAPAPSSRRHRGLPG